MAFCELDRKVFSGAKSVYNHNKLHLNEEHQCHECGKSFATLHYLKEHKKKTHTDALYPCNECNEQFKIEYTKIKFSLCDNEICPFMKNIVQVFWVLFSGVSHICKFSFSFRR